MSQVISRKALNKSLVEEGILTKEEFYGMVKAVDQEAKRRRRNRLRLLSVGPTAFIV
ncbi:MAG: hypothetical protein MUP27_11090 [Desulfobacterales bacterium]|nr:hypothetical protein [Desulfobacterales bacterium]